MATEVKTEASTLLYGASKASKSRVTSMIGALDWMRAVTWTSSRDSGRSGVCTNSWASGGIPMDETEFDSPGVPRSMVNSVPTSKVNGDWLGKSPVFPGLSGGLVMTRKPLAVRRLMSCPIPLMYLTW